VVLVAIGAAWYGLAVLTAVMSNPAETLQSTIDQAAGPAPVGWSWNA